MCSARRETPSPPRRRHRKNEDGEDDEEEEGEDTAMDTTIFHQETDISDVGFRLKV